MVKIEENQISIVFEFNGKQYGMGFNFKNDLSKKDWMRIEKAVKSLALGGIVKLKQLSGRDKEENNFIENLPKYINDKKKMKEFDNVLNSPFFHHAKRNKTN